MNTPSPEPKILHSEHLPLGWSLKSPVPGSRSNLRVTAKKVTGPTASPAQSLGQILISAGGLVAHFGRMLRGRSRSYCYSRQFDCGAVATVVFKHFRNATLRTVLWESPCRCKGLLKRLCCEWEFRTWLGETEGQEKRQTTFGSLTMGTPFGARYAGPKK